MKAHVLGFQIQTPAYVTLTNILKHIANAGTVKFAGYERMLFLEDQPKYLIGLLITTKDHRRLCELQTAGKQLRINVREVAKGTSLIDFNFFAIWKETGRGLYQWYFNSAHPKVLCRMCDDACVEIQEKLIAVEVAKSGGKDIDEKTEQNINKRYSDALEWSMIVRRESFEALVRKFQRIGSFEFSFAAVQPEQERRFRPLTGVASMIREKVTFSRDKDVKERSAAILNFLKAEKENLEDAAVHGRYEDGLEKTIALMDNPDSFGHYEFDELAKGMDFEPTAFPDSWFMGELLSVAEKNKDVLQAKVR